MILNWWILLILIPTTGSIEPDYELHKKVLSTLAHYFSALPVRKQYGVMYMHPPSADIGSVAYQTGLPILGDYKGNVTVPHVTKENKDYFEYTYISTTPDYRGAMYSAMMNRSPNVNLHTEDLMLNLVYNGMKNWYTAQYGNNLGYMYLYLYTYYLPCAGCFEVIKNFFNKNQQVTLFVGWSKKLGDNNNANIVQNENRRQALENLLSDKNGKLFEINFECKRRRRSTGRACGVSGNITELTLSIEFTTGKVRISYLYLPSVTNSWIGLYDAADREIERHYVITSTGAITFNSLMNENYSTKFWKNDNNIYLETVKWKQCGYDWTVMNKLPCQYGILRMRVQIQDGAPYVCLLQTGKWRPNSSDWLMAQPLVNFTSNKKWNNWQAISSFISAGENTVCKKFNKLDNSYQEGFRVKYVYNNGTDQYEGPYDNSSPVWIQSECSVSSSRHIKDKNSNPISGAKRTGVNMIMVTILVFAVFNSNICNLISASY